MRKIIKEFCKEIYPDPSTGYDPEEDYDYHGDEEEIEFTPQETELIGMLLQANNIMKTGSPTRDGIWFADIKRLNQFDYFCRVMGGLVKLGFISGENIEYGEQGRSSSYADESSKAYAFTADTLDIIYPRFFAQKLVETIENMNGGISSFTILPTIDNKMQMLISFDGMAHKIGELND